MSSLAHPLMSPTPFIVPWRGQKCKCRWGRKSKKKEIISMEEEEEKELVE